MIDILYLENKEHLLSEYTDLIVSLIGDTEKRRLFRYRRWQDKQAFLLGKLLVGKLLEKHGYSQKLLKHLHYTKFKRPYIKEIKVDFNISHSGEFVICAFSVDQVVGVDIEQIRPIELTDFFYLLNEIDKEKITNCDDKYTSFFKIWSTKEAILKANGRGLVDHLHELEINGNKGIFENTEYYHKELFIDSLYSSCIASPAPIKISSIEKVSINNCF